MNCGAGKRWKDSVVPGTLDVGGGGTDGSENLLGCIGLNPGTPDPTAGAEDGGKGIVYGGIAGEAGLKRVASDPTTGPEDEKGDVV